MPDMASVSVSASLDGTSVNTMTTLSPSPVTVHTASVDSLFSSVSVSSDSSTTFSQSPVTVHTASSDSLFSSVSASSDSSTTLSPSQITVHTASSDNLFSSVSASSDNSTTLSPSPVTVHTASSDSLFSSMSESLDSSTQSVSSDMMFYEPKDNSSTSAYNDSLPLDAVTGTLPASATTTDSSLNFTSSASLFPSSSSLDVTTDSFSRTDALPNGTTGFVGLTDSSVDVSGEGDVINTTTTTVLEVDGASTVIQPTPSSGSGDWWSGSVLSSACGNGSDVSVPGGDGGAGEGWSDLLIIAVPVGVTLLLALIILIIICVRCCRRKKVKETKPTQEDLWMKQDSTNIPAIPLTTWSETETGSSPPVAEDAPVAVQSAKCSQSEDQRLYVVIYEFISQLDSQLTLTPGDIIRVQEQADNGWWRGVSQGDNRTGWFPSSFVSPVNVDTEREPASARPQSVSEPDLEPDQEPQAPRPRISSFLIRKKPTMRPLHMSNSLGNCQPQTVPNSSVPRAATAVHPVAPVKLTSTSSICADDFSSSVKDKFFKTVFAYKAAYRGEMSLREGEIIIGKERDKNGWMLGRKKNSAEEGWFPAVYVDQITGDVSMSAEGKQGEGAVTSHLDHEVYDVLAVNRTKSPDQSWVAIEHRTVKKFTSGSSTQMSLQVGDVVAVVEALDTGWWLGCHGDQLGWFPGDHVELVEEKTEDIIDTLHLFPRRPDMDRTIRDDSLSRDSLDSRDTQDHLASLNASRESMLSEGGRPKPARRAPKAPLQRSRDDSVGNLSGISSLSTNPRPARPAPAPPSAKGRSASVGSMDRLETDRGTGAGRRRKARKPRIVRIPKEKLGLDKLSSFPAPDGGSPTSVPSPTVPSFPVSRSHGSKGERKGNEGRHSPSAGSQVQQTTASKVHDNVNERNGNISPAHSAVNPSNETSPRETSPTLHQPRNNHGQENTPSTVPQPEQSRPDVALQHNQDDIPLGENKENKNTKNTAMNPQITDIPPDAVSKTSTPAANGFPVTSVTSGSSNDDQRKSNVAQDDVTQTQSLSGDNDLDSHYTNGTKTPQDVPPQAASHPEHHTQDLTSEENGIAPSHTATVSACPLPDLVETAREPVVRPTPTDDSSGKRPAEPTANEKPTEPPAAKNSTEPSVVKNSTEPPAAKNSTEAPAAKNSTEPPAAKNSTEAPAGKNSTEPAAKRTNKQPPASRIPRPSSKISSETKSQMPTKRSQSRPQSAPTDQETDPTKLTPVALRATPAKEAVDSDDEGILIPPEGQSGRVSLIVEHINRMSSVEEQRSSPRKTSAQFNPDSLERIKDTESEDSAAPASTQHNSGSAEDAANPQNNLTNGNSPSSPPETTSAINHNGIADPSRNRELPEDDSVKERQRNSAGGQEGSKGEGHARPQSIKKSRVAPPPPKSPPPPLLRRSKKLTVTQERQSEC